MVMLTMLTVSMMAVPANRKAVKITQPDGSTVTIQLQGDEWQHFNTTTDGYSVVKNQDTDGGTQCPGAQGQRAGFLAGR